MSAIGQLRTAGPMGLSATTHTGGSMSIPKAMVRTAAGGSIEPTVWRRPALFICPMEPHMLLS